MKRAVTHKNLYARPAVAVRGGAMVEVSRHDAWQAGDNYDRYMGRWSRRVAPAFLDWLDVPEGLDWLEVGCGTGALSQAILSYGGAAHLVAIDPSEGFIATARTNVPDPRAAFAVGDAQGLALPDASRDVIVSGLVLNFVPDRAAALAEMRRVARPGGRVGFYVWDYAGRGVEFMRAFWTAAAALDPDAAALAEDRRFAWCTPDDLTRIAEAAGLAHVACTRLEVVTVFADFADFWRPFTLGTGPAPGYCVSLDPGARDVLRDRLDTDLKRQPDGSIAMTARAWGVKASVP